VAALVQERDKLRIELDAFQEWCKRLQRANVADLACMAWSRRVSPNPANTTDWEKSVRLTSRRFSREREISAKMFAEARRRG